MKVEITRWQRLRHAGNVIASFNFRVGGITVRAALFQRWGDGYRITMPFTQHRDAEGNGVTAVGLDYELFQAVNAAAVAYYEELPADAVEDETAGLRRVLCAGGEESLERAGI